MSALANLNKSPLPPRPTAPTGLDRTELGRNELGRNELGRNEPDRKEQGRNEPEILSRESRLDDLRHRLKGMPGGQMTSAQGSTQGRVTLAEEGISPEELAGRLIEVSDPGQGADQLGASTSWAAARVAEAHRRGDTAAWILCSADDARRGQPYPPDLAEQGIDLAALPIVCARDGPAVLHAADVLLRSGGFGLVIAEWPHGVDRPSEGALGRLLGLCQKHDAALLWLTDGSQTAEGGRMGSLISLRLEAGRQPYQPDRGADRLGPGLLRLKLTVRKDKRQGPGRTSLELRRAPLGIW